MNRRPEPAFAVGKDCIVGGKNFFGERSIVELTEATWDEIYSDWLYTDERGRTFTESYLIDPESNIEIIKGYEYENEEALKERISELNEEVYYLKKELEKSKSEVVKLKNIVGSIKSTYNTFKSIMSELEKG